MALTIAIEGKGVIANADSESADTGGSGTGTWAELGGGTIAVSGVAIQGGDAIAGGYSNKDGYQYFDIGAGNELDFGSGGAEEDQLIYLWVQMPALSQLDTLANEGLVARIGNSTSVYRDYLFASNDDSNGWLGGWKCFVLDINKTPTSSAGTFDFTSVRTFGFYINTSSAGRGDNFFADRIAVGKGLRITGTSTQGWKDVVDYCIASVNALGMFEEREGIYYCKGKIWIGDSAQTAITSFADSGRTIKFERCEYYTGSAWVSSIPVDAFGIVIEDSSGFATTFSDGVIVGSDNGRSGSTFEGNVNEDISLDLFGGNNAGSLTTCYGTKFQAIYGVFNSGNDSDHKFLGCSFVNSARFDPVGAPVIRNCTFAETADGDAALLWNANIDIKSCNFIANSVGAAIEHPVQGSFNYDALFFSGNTYDILYSAAASSGLLTINAQNGADPSTYEITNSTGNTVSILNPKTKTFTGLPENVEIRIRQGSYSLAHVQSVTGGSYAFNYTPDNSKPARAQFTLPGYVFKPVEFLLDSNSQTIAVTVEPDPSYI